MVAAALSPSKLTFATGSEDGCTLAPVAQEAAPLPSAAPCTEVLACPTVDLAGAYACRESQRPVPAGLQATDQKSELNGVGDGGAETDNVFGDVDQEEAALLTVELESPETSEAEVAAPPSAPTLLSAPPSPPPSLAAAPTTPSLPSPPPLPLPGAPPALQGDLEGEEAARAALSEVAQDVPEREEGEADGQPQESPESQGLNSRADPGPGEQGVQVQKWLHC